MTEILVNPSAKAKSISAEFPFESKYLEVNGSQIHYIDEGEGDPILFLHGNPMSNYLWRNIVPYMNNQGRAIAPDLIGMGKSSKPDIEYGFENTFRYLDDFIEKLSLKNITLILHDWGSGLGFHYANRHRDNIKAIVFMEAMYDEPDLTMMPKSLQFALKMMRAPVVGDFMVKNLNIFIKKMIPDLISRKLTKEEMAVYAAPYQTVKSRAPLVAWPRSLPVNGEPKVEAQAVAAYHKWLNQTDIPKLFFYVSPGIGLKADAVARIKRNVKNMKVINLGEGLHFIQEDYPHEIGEAIRDWYKTLPDYPLSTASDNAVYNISK
jgi:haloalkane dehalogenase